MENLDEFQIPKEVLDKLKDPLHLQRELDSGKSFQEILGYSVETMDKFYEAAHSLYQKQQYEEAANAFVFLTTLNPMVHNYWLGLGMSEQLNEEYHSALMAYNMAILTDAGNPLPHYHSASCHHAVYDKDQALISLEKAIKQAGDHAEHAFIKTHAQSALNKLNQKK